MFESNSRYARLAIKTLNVPGEAGEPRQIRYVERRFIPPSAGTTLLEHLVTQGDRLDNLSARYLGDPTLFWQIADANSAAHPEELTDATGTRINVALPR